jgi:hypothetical protein
MLVVGSVLAAGGIAMVGTGVDMYLRLTDSAERCREHRFWLRSGLSNFAAEGVVIAVVGAVAITGGGILVGLGARHGPTTVAHRSSTMRYLESVEPTASAPPPSPPAPTPPDMGAPDGGDHLE